MNIGKAIIAKYPGSQFSIEETYESLIWLDESKPKPTLEEYNQALSEYQTYIDETKPERDRKMEYEKEGITIDALTVAVWEKLIEGRSESADALQAKRLAIKQKIPKNR